MPASLKIIFKAFILAIALVASSWFLRGTQVGVWVDAGLYIAIGVFFLRVIWQECRRDRCRREEPTAG